MSRLTLIMVMCALALILALTVRLNHTLAESRAMHCSRILHGYSAGTLVPLTKHASIEIGACLLQFNQPLATGEEE